LEVIFYQSINFQQEPKCAFYCFILLIYVEHKGKNILFHAKPGTPNRKQPLDEGGALNYVTRMPRNCCYFLNSSEPRIIFKITESGQMTISANAIKEGNDASISIDFRKGKEPRYHHRSENFQRNESSR